MPFLRTSIDERDERVSIQTELGAEWKFQTGPPIPLELLHADLSKTFGGLTLFASGGLPAITGDFSKSLGLLSASAGATAANAGNLSKTFGALTSSSTGSVPIGAAFTKTLGALTLLASESMGVTSQVSGTNFTTTSLTLVDVTGLTFAVDTGANHLYEVDVVLKVQSTSTAGLQAAIACSSSGATGEYTGLANVAQSTSSVGYNARAIGTAIGVNLSSTANTDSIIWFKAMVSTTSGNAGNITVQVQKITSGTATVYIGSRMTVTTLT
jgi:hypothetical protein